MTFNEIWDEFLSHKRRRVKPSTIANYSANWNTVKEFFGDMEIDKISTKAVEKWAIDLLDTLSKKSIKDKIILINNIVGYYEYEYEVKVSKVNMKYIHWPTANTYKGEVEKVKTFTLQDIQAIINKIAEDPQPYNILIAIMIGTGIRIGEACALKYENININNGTIEIKGTVERITLDKSLTDEDFKRMNVEILHRAAKSILILSTPKCVSSCRAIPVPSELLKVLKKFKSVFPEKYYIGTNSYTVIEPRRLRTQYYRLLESLGIDNRLTPHSLRHTYATTLLTSGVDIKTTAALLGHGDAGTTLEVYSHATVESKKKAVTNTIAKQFKQLLGK